MSMYRERQAEKRDRLLSVDQRDHPSSTATLDEVKRAQALGIQPPALQDRCESRNEDEKPEEQADQLHMLVPLL